jgi:nucleotide-binding universal stress UspA family protein
MKALYPHILLPTDGSALATRGAKAGVRLARAIGSRITVVFVAPPFTAAVYGGAEVFYAGPSSPAEHKRFTQEAAQKAFAPVARAAERAGVDCTELFAVNARPWEGILKAARARKCDALVMASHGRTGLAGLLLGSETQRVLAHSKIPVLVIR